MDTKVYISDGVVDLVVAVVEDRVVLLAAVDLVVVIEVVVTLHLAVDITAIVHRQVDMVDHLVRHQNQNLVHLQHPILHQERDQNMI